LAGGLTERRWAGETKGDVRLIRASYFATSFPLGSWYSNVAVTQQRLDIPSSSWGLLLAVYPVSSLISLRLYAGMISDAVRHRVFSAALFALPLTTIALVYSPSQAILGACLALLGVLSAILQVESNSRAHEIEEYSGSPIFASCHGYFSAGVIIAGLSALVAEQLDLGVWLFCTSMAVTASVALLVFRPNSLRSRENGRRESRENKSDSSSFPHLGLVSLTLMGMAVLFVESAVNTWHSAFVDEAAGFHGYAGAAYATYALGGLLVRFSGDRIRRKHGIFFLFVLLSPLAVISLLTAIHSEQVAVILLALFLLGAAMGIAYPDILKIAAISEKGGSASRISIVATGSAAGSLLANPTIGLVSGIYSVRISFILIALIVAITACYPAYVLIRRRMEGT
jgi:MFS family permease